MCDSIGDDCKETNYYKVQLRISFNLEYLLVIVVQVVETVGYPV